MTHVLLRCLHGFDSLSDTARHGATAHKWLARLSWALLVGAAVFFLVGSVSYLVDNDVMGIPLVLVIVDSVLGAAGLLTLASRALAVAGTSLVADGATRDGESGGAVSGSVPADGDVKHRLHADESGSVAAAAADARTPLVLVGSAGASRSRVPYSASPGGASARVPPRPQAAASLRSDRWSLSTESTDGDIALHVVAVLCVIATAVTVFSSIAGTPVVLAIITLGQSVPNTWAAFYVAGACLVIRTRARELAEAIESGGELPAVLVSAAARGALLGPDSERPTGGGASESLSTNASLAAPAQALRAYMRLVTASESLSRQLGILPLIQVFCIVAMVAGLAKSYFEERPTHTSALTVLSTQLSIIVYVLLLLAIAVSARAMACANEAVALAASRRLAECGDAAAAPTPSASGAGGVSSGPAWIRHAEQQQWWFLADAATRHPLHLDAGGVQFSQEVTMALMVSGLAALVAILGVDVPDV